MSEKVGESQAALENEYMDDTDRLMLIPELAAKMKTSQKLVKQLIDMQLLKSLKFGRISKVRKTTYEKFLADMEGKDILDLIK